MERVFALVSVRVKNTCYRAVISNRKVIGCAEDVHHFFTEKLKMENTDNEAKTVSRREFILVKDVERNREETDVQTLQEKKTSYQKDHNSATSEKPNKKQKSTERHNIVTKKIKVYKKAPTNTEKPIEKYHPGKFVALGLKPKKGPLDVYLAEVKDILHNDVRLKYMRKSGNMYVWPEKR
ncbi:hypothetical protein CHS0354_024636 [Potamilus streckersoni]|uniref:Uncharacterized protein n=1 Tax=Potamilus streckersoni TaxID=2493646 RepID=A0AAE0W3J9_9BIVA|nr:hypothetical protein CHS0354_024636 [Potamilus streckersoni]